ncbi:hypothetical protein KCU77_g136, partial [Aureobasidium melanogenum]
MAQAIGRVRRPGQYKLMQVYRIVVLDTIDVDILEHHEHRTTVMAEYQHSNLKKKLVSGTNFNAEDGQKLKLVPRQMLLAAGGEGQPNKARDAVSAKEEQINDLERKLADTNKRSAMLVDQINSKRAGQPDNTAFLVERREALEKAKKL